MNDKQVNRDNKVIVNKKIYSRFEPPLYVPAFTTVKDFTIHNRIFYKGTLQKGIIMVYKRQEYTTLILNPLHKR